MYGITINLTNIIFIGYILSWTFSIKNPSKTIFYFQDIIRHQLDCSLFVRANLQKRMP